MSNTLTPVGFSISFDAIVNNPLYFREEYNRFFDKYSREYNISIIGGKDWLLVQAYPKNMNLNENEGSTHAQEIKEPV